MKNAEELKEQILDEFSINCPDCDNSGTKAINSHYNPPEPEQCQFCYEHPQSRFRLKDFLTEYATIREKETKNEILKLIPTTWLDPLLSGDKAINVPAGCPDIEKLLQAIKDRIDDWYTKQK